MWKTSVWYPISFKDSNRHDNFFLILNNWTKNSTCKKKLSHLLRHKNNLLTHLNALHLLFTHGFCSRETTKRIQIKKWGEREMPYIWKCIDWISLTYLVCVCISCDCAVVIIYLLKKLFFGHIKMYENIFDSWDYIKRIWRVKRVQNILKATYCAVFLFWIFLRKFKNSHTKFHSCFCSWFLDFVIYYIL